MAIAKDELRLIHGMHKETAKRYFQVREEIEIIVDRVHTIGDLMSLLRHADCATINHLTASWIGTRLKKDILKILNHLDNDFVYITRDDLEKFDTPTDDINEEQT